MSTQVHTNEPKVKIEEVVSYMYPSKESTIFQALLDAHLEGFEKIEILKGGTCATITWYRRVHD